MSNEGQAIQKQLPGTGNSPNEEKDMPIFTYASIGLDSSNYSHRCFMTGESCSMQESIARERRELHGTKNSINAFVVMSFSNVTDVVYKWRIKPFVESLHKNLYFNRSHTRLYCFGPKEPSSAVLDEIISKEPFSRHDYRESFGSISQYLSKQEQLVFKEVIDELNKEHHNDLICIQDFMGRAEKKSLINKYKPQELVGLFEDLTEKEKTDFFDYLADSKTGTFDLLSIKTRQALVDNISAIEHQTYKSIPLSNLSKEEKKNYINRLTQLEKSELFDAESGKLSQEDINNLYKLIGDTSKESGAALVSTNTNADNKHYFGPMCDKDRSAFIDGLKGFAKAILFDILSKQEKKSLLNLLAEKGTSVLFGDLSAKNRSTHLRVLTEDELKAISDKFKEALYKLLVKRLERKLKDALQITIIKQLTQEQTNTVFFEPVDTINVIRADSNPSLNYVICNRICQQLQIADLVIVDVSVENANVFYELGMAVALGKLVLPICYSENFYKQSEAALKRIADNPALEHHIENYRWRRELFEHFCIRFRNTEYSDEIKDEIRKRRITLRSKAMEKKSSSGNDPRKAELRTVQCADENASDDKDLRNWETRYLPFKIASNPKNCFSDSKYAQLPYLENYERPFSGPDVYEGNNPLGVRPKSNTQTNGASKNDADTIKVGEYLYKKLYISYNYSSCEENTLVVYTLDAFMNEEQAPQCIINYYHAVIRQFKDAKCFRGDRVGVLLQSTNVIPDDAKDAPEGTKHFYRVGDIIQIGVNQATYRAHKEMIKPDSFMTLSEASRSDTAQASSSDNGEPKESPEKKKAWHENSIIFAKQFVRNRAMPVYTCDPVYVKRVKDGLQDDVFKNIKLDSTNFPDQEQSDECAQYFFCLFHIMLKTLQYTNEIVVDISQNAVQAYFWLGAAHASDVNAITVRREATDRERLAVTGSAEKKERFIFDVAGLWSAVYRTADPDGFYEQLAKAQSGIEQKSRLLLKRRDYFTEQLTQNFWDAIPDNALSEIKKLHDEKEKQEDAELESYYRNEFWRPMLRCNRLRIYLQEQQKNDVLFVSKWDNQAAETISHYLSTKKQIGEYQFKTIPYNRDVQSPSVNHLQWHNFICIGGRTEPISGTPMHEYINRMSDRSVYKAINDTKLVDCFEYESENKDEKSKGDMHYRGFENSEITSEQAKDLWTQVPEGTCCECKIYTEGRNPQAQHSTIIHSIDENEKHKCLLSVKSPHFLLAQLVLICNRATEEVPFDRFGATVFGGSGPATCKLASILVDRSLKEIAPDSQGRSEASKADTKEAAPSSEETAEDTKMRDFPLSWMQAKIRVSLIRQYREDLKEEATALLKKYLDDDPDTGQKNNQNNNQINNQNNETIKVSDYFLNWFFGKPEKQYAEDNNTSAEDNNTNSENSDKKDDPNKIKEQKKKREKQEPSEKCRKQLLQFFSLVADSAEYYLSSVLYRYFLPFLSTDDIARICNGMKMYVSSLRAANLSPFALSYPAHTYDNYDSTMPGEIINAAAYLAPCVLEKLLKRFCGVEVFYEVGVSGCNKVSGSSKATGSNDVTKNSNHNNTIDADTRKAVSIQQKNDIKLLFRKSEQPEQK